MNERIEGEYISLFKLFLIFVKIGAILLGGGYVILPIIQNEFAEKRKLLSKDDIVNYFALAQSLPGIVAANVSMFIGYCLKGKLGAVVGMFGIIFVPFWTIVLLASIISSLANNSYINAVFWGVEIAVIALITLTIREMLQNSKKGVYFYSIFLASLLVLFVFKFPPVQTILTMSFLGVLIKVLQRRFSK